MAKEWAKAFYCSTEWRKCRAAFLKSRSYICERCGGPANEVHHKTMLTKDNIHDPNIALNWNNLEALCGCCHKEETRRQYERGGAIKEGCYFDKEGNIHEYNDINIKRK